MLQDFNETAGCPSIPQAEPEDTGHSSDFFIRVETHPDANVPDKIIPLNSMDAAQDNPQPKPNPSPTYAYHPWAPFRSLADFEFTEIAVRSNLPKQVVDSQLHLLHNSWTKHSEITLNNHSDMMAVLTSARDLSTSFQTGSVTRTYRGKPYTFNFCFRDPWKWVISLATDPTLADLICWYPVRKYLHNGTNVMRLFDEPQTAERWWDIQDDLKKSGEHPHCFLPILIWLDKGNITKKVKLHPIIARASFLPSYIRNASGNGGGILLGYVPSVSHAVGFQDTLTEAEKAEHRVFKQQVYHGVLGVVFESFYKLAQVGECVTCADQVTRVLFSGIPYAALDGEEAWTYACTRAASANFPCPSCLVPQEKLSSITESFPLRTTDSMRNVLQEARAAPTATEKSHILKRSGLHDVDNFFWSLPNSDPYKAISYDTLHKDDQGKFGKHLFPVVQNVLEQEGLMGKMNQNMNSVPRWSNLKHFSQVMHLEYVDGRDMFHISKCIIPCLVQLLPKNSSLLHCIRSYARIRMMVDLDCISEDDLSRLEGYIARYQHFCELVSQEYGKSFKFPKQHDTSHIVSEIRKKGATHNYSTRPGESFHQEARLAYERTDRRNVDPQITRADERQEVVARIRLEIDESSKLDSLPAASSSTERKSQSKGVEQLNQHRSNTGKHWTLKGDAHRRWVSCLDLQATVPTTPGFKDLDRRLRKFLHTFVSPDLASDDCIELRQYNCLALRYVSSVDWSSQSDLLRSNPSFNGMSRYDCALLNTDSKNLEFVRLQLLLTCRLPSGSLHDVALVSRLRASAKWKPKTVWDGCIVYQEQKTTEFILLDYLIRGAHFISFYDIQQPNAYCLNDLVDGDWFIRAGN
ncbi:hypothetical protein K435DRAFT_818849 [Dendrothele bispora CBS 962.96]|uniref:Uncharacterized protein n=1 Tax=Dendrothele bispora (strain CBS 962.96) TaxID=1314807 RepID=A0A4S8M8P0_DENBC|nr:hypothetical protein K435DRAFT_818849 [Dendrothele bispora CBS 962.96]